MYNAYKNISVHGWYRYEGMNSIPVNSYFYGRCIPAWTMWHRFFFLSLERFSVLAWQVLISNKISCSVWSFERQFRFCGCAMHQDLLQDPRAIFVVVVAYQCIISYVTVPLGRLNLFCWAKCSLFLNIRNTPDASWYLSNYCLTLPGPGLTT